MRFFNKYSDIKKEFGSKFKNFSFGISWISWCKPQLPQIVICMEYFGGLLKRAICKSLTIGLLPKSNPKGKLD